MSGIRPFAESDIESVSTLWNKCYRRRVEPASAAVRQCFRDMFLDSPWFDPDLPSLVYVDSDGRVVGFVGRMHRPMLFMRQRIRCAVGTQLLVDPDSKRPFCATELLRAVLAGPQDLTYCDGASSIPGRMWELLGGQTSLVHSMEWQRNLLPGQALLVGLERHRSVGRWARMFQPAAGVVDRLAVRTAPRVFRKPASAPRASAATAAEILPLLARVAGSVLLAAEYDLETLTWLLARAAESQRYGRLRTLVVRDQQRENIGWFVYLVKAGRVAQVLQLGALPKRGAEVIACLLHDAWEQNAAAVAGQLDPLLVSDLSNAHCALFCRGLDALVHARDADILGAVRRGDAFLSRLDGEWWIRLGVDRMAAW